METMRVETNCFNDYSRKPMVMSLRSLDVWVYIASKFIDERCDIFGYDEGVKIEMHNLRDKMESLIIAMIKYVAIFETIAKESESER